MAHSGKTMTFATDLVPQENNVYSLGFDKKKWKIFGEIQPLSTKTYDAPLYNSSSGANYYQTFATVIPADYNAIWIAHYRITITADGHSDYTEICDVSISGRSNTYYSYKIYNSIVTYSIYQHMLLNSNSASNNLHELGYRMASSYGATDVSKVVKVELLEQINCTVTLLDNLKLYTSATPSGYTWRGFNATSNGLQETGDINDTGLYIYSNGFKGKAGSNKVYRYCLFARTGDGTYESFVMQDNTRATTKTANPHGFVPDGKIYWNSGNSTYSEGTLNISVYEQYHVIDYLYSFNFNNTFLPDYCETYVVYTYNEEDGLLYLDTTQWLAAALPTTADGKIYQRIGSKYYTGTSNYYQGSLLLNNPYYEYKDGEIRSWSATHLSSITGADDLKAIEALSDTSGFLKKTAANTWILDTPVLTNVSYTAATDNNEYPILLKNSTGSDTTAAGVKFANNTNKMTTINPSTGMITAPSLTIASNAAIAHLAFARAGWNYVTMPNNDSSVISIGYGTQADNTTQRLVIYKTGTVRPGANGSQNLGDDTHKWNNVYGVNFYGNTFSGTANKANYLRCFGLEANDDLNLIDSHADEGIFQNCWVGGGEAGSIQNRPDSYGVASFGMLAFKIATNWTGQILLSTNSAPGLYWRANNNSSSPAYGAWARVWDSSNHRVFYGTCAEAAGTAAKTVGCANYDGMKVGDIITVKFDNTNTAASPTLNVNGKGSKSIKMAYSGGTADLSSYTQLAGIRTFIYDGTNWILQEGECVKQGVTDTTSDIWRPVMLGAYNSTDVRQAPEQRYAMVHAARNVKYHQATGTLRAPVLKTPKLSIEYSFEDKAHIEWNDTDSSIDFIFD